MPVSHENPLWNQTRPMMEQDSLCEGEFDKAVPRINQTLTEGIPNDQASFFYGNSQCIRPFYKVPQMVDNDKFKDFLYKDAFAHNTHKQGSVYAHLGSPYNAGI